MTAAVLQQYETFSHFAYDFFSQEWKICCLIIYLFIDDIIVALLFGVPPSASLQEPFL